MKRRRASNPSPKPNPEPSPEPLLLNTLRCEPGLLWPMLRHLCDDAESLLALYWALRTTVLWPQLVAHFDTVWFFAYKATWPGELVHAWELDWMTANAATWWRKDVNNLLFKLESIGGVMLDATFPRAAHLGLNARQLYARRHKQPSRYMQLAYSVEPCSSALRPPALVSQWSLDTLKLRRLVWSLLRRIAVTVDAYWKQNAWSTCLVEFRRDGDVQWPEYDTRGLWLHSAVFTHLNGALMAPCIAWDSAKLQRLLEPPPYHYRQDELLGHTLPLQQTQWWRDTVDELVTEIDNGLTPSGDGDRTLLETLSVTEEEEQGVVGPQWAWLCDGEARHGLFRRLYNASVTELARAT